MRVKSIKAGGACSLPASTVGTHCAAGRGPEPEPDAARILGHDPFMKRLPFEGVAITWGAAEEFWDGSTLQDRLYAASLRFVKTALEGM